MKKNISQFSALIVCLLLFSVFVLGITSQNNASPVTQPTTQTYRYQPLNINSSILNIFYFSVGTADSILILLENKVMLIDAANAGDGDNIVQFLKAQGIQKIDYLIGTHVDKDHIGGMYKIIRHIHVQNLYVPQYENGDRDAYNKIQESIRENPNSKLKLKSLQAKQRIPFGVATFTVLSAQTMEDIHQDVNEINNTSVVLQLNYKNKKYLFTGDMEKWLENKLLLESGENALGKVDVLKVAHHGADTGTTTEFLARTLPTYAIISSGSSDTKHPNEKCLKRLLEGENGLKPKNIFITERDGTIWQVSDGKSEDLFFKMPDINLDGNGNVITPEEWNIPSLESILDQYAFFFGKIPITSLMKM